MLSNHLNLMYYLIYMDFLEGFSSDIGDTRPNIETYKRQC